MQLQRQIQMLQQKINSQQQLLENLNSQQLRLKHYINEFRESIKKKSTSIKLQGNKTSIDQTGKTLKQLQKQLKNISIAYKNSQHVLKNLQKRQTAIKTIDLTDIEEQCREKQLLCRNLKQSIKQLQSMKRKKQKIHKQKVKNDDGGKLTKIIEEVRKNKQILEAYVGKRKQKQDVLTKKVQNLSELQHRYLQACKTNHQTPLSYQEFKEKKREKRKQEKNQSRNKHSSVNKKQVQSVRDIIHGQFLNQKMFEPTEKSVKQLKVKKQIAQTALKKAYQKYEKQIQEIENKIEGLNKENDNLNTRLLEKKKEKQMLDSNIVDYTKSHNSTKTTRKLTPIK